MTDGPQGIGCETIDDTQVLVSDLSGALILDFFRLASPLQESHLPGCGSKERRIQK
jgi:hypothetical protein